MMTLQFKKIETEPRETLKHPMYNWPTARASLTHVIHTMSDSSFDRSSRFTSGDVCLIFANSVIATESEQQSLQDWREMKRNEVVVFLAEAKTKIGRYLATFIIARDQILCVKYLKPEDFLFKNAVWQIDDGDELLKKIWALRRRQCVRLL